MKILVTGNAGFIGFHVASRLLERGDSVVGLDNVNDYYDPNLKEARLAELDKIAEAAVGTYSFVRGDIADQTIVDQLFLDHNFDRVIHLAAQAGVRYSLENPRAYIRSNIDGFLNILEACRHHGIAHLTYASSSSVYGGNKKLPFSEHDGINHPLSLYAATKRADELMAHTYSHLYDLPTTGLRFFTVYGPWGRPDMALFLFTKNILEGKPIQVFNHGHHTRDFTFVGDIVEGVVRVSDDVAGPDASWQSEAPDPSSSDAPFRIFNIGNNNPVKLSEYIEGIEVALGRKAIKELLGLQPGDVPDTYADVSLLQKQIGYRPATTVKEGIAKFIDWYRTYFNV